MTRQTPAVVCTCGCGRYISRRTVRRHLQGIGAQEVLVSQQKRLLFSIRPSRNKGPSPAFEFGCAQSSVQDAQAASHANPLGEMQQPLQPKGSEIDPVPLSTNVAANSTNTGSESTLDASIALSPLYNPENCSWTGLNCVGHIIYSSDDDSECSELIHNSEADHEDELDIDEDEMDDDDSATWDNDELDSDVPPWYQGMSATDEILEEFENAVATQGTRFIFIFVNLKPVLTERILTRNSFIRG